MNSDACDGATKRPVSLKNEATPDASVFSGATPAPTAGAASTTVPDDYILPTGQKLHTKPFYPLNTNKIAKKDTVNNILEPDSTTAAPADTISQFPGLTLSNYPYSLRDHNFLTSFISTKKTKK